MGNTDIPGSLWINPNGQLRYKIAIDKPNMWHHPLSTYKAGASITYGQPVSIADPRTIVPTDPQVHDWCVGIALEQGDEDDNIHILSSGQLTLNTNWTTDDINNTVYVSTDSGLTLHIEEAGTTPLIVGRVVDVNCIEVSLSVDRLDNELTRLDGAIATERNARITGDNELSISIEEVDNRVTTEISNVNNMVAAQIENITVDINTVNQQSIDRDNLLSRRIDDNDTEISRINNVLDTLSGIGDVNSELLRIEEESKERDNILSTRIDTDIEYLNNLMNYELNTLRSALEQETGDRLMSVNDLYNLIEIEKTERIDAIEQLSSDKQSQIDNLTGTVEVLSDNLVELESRIIDISDRTSVIEQNVGLIESTVSNLNEQVSSIQDNINQVNNRITSEVYRIDSQIDTIEQANTARDEKIDHLDSEIIRLDSAIEEVDRRIDTLIGDIDERVTNSENDIISLAERVSTNENDVADMKVDVSSLQETAESTKQVISGIENDITSLDNRISANEESISERLTEPQVDSRIETLRPVDVPLPPIPEPDEEPVVVTYSLQATVTSGGVITYHWVPIN